MLQSVEVTGENDIVSWGPRGLAFIILDKHRFMTIVAPKYLNVFSHATFRMIAESWGFMIDQDEHHEIFHHPYFLRDDPFKCNNLTMQDMKQLSLNGDATGGSKLEDAMLLLPTGNTTASGNSRSQRDKSKSPFTEKQIKRLPKKSSYNVRKPGLGEKKGIKNSVIKGYLDGTLRFNNGGNPTMGNGMVRPQPGPSSRVAMLNTRRRHSIHSTMPVSMLPPQEMVSMTPYHAATSPAVNSTAKSEQPKPKYQQHTPKVAKQISKQKGKSGLSSDLSFLMYKGAVISNKGGNFLDDMRDILSYAEKTGFHSIVSWIAHGRAFIIYDEKEFQKHVLPRFSNKSSFASFQTALSRWGFHRFEDLSNLPSKRGVYYHPLFSRDLPHYCKNKTSMQMKATSYREGDPLPLSMTALGFPNNTRRIRY